MEKARVLLVVRIATPAVPAKPYSVTLRFYLLSG